MFKSRLGVKLDSEKEWNTCSASILLTTQLQSLIETQAARKFVVHCSDSSKSREGLLLWVFNPDIYYSSSAKPPHPHRAMKIFYQVIEDPLQELDENSLLEELHLYQEDFAEVWKDLEDSKKILPQSMKRFQDWHVGLLDRHQTSSSLGMDNMNPLNQKPSFIIGLPKGTQGVEGLLK